MTPPTLKAPAPVDTREPRTASEALRKMAWQAWERAIRYAEKSERPGHGVDIAHLYAHKADGAAVVAEMVLAEADRLSALEQAPVLSEEEKVTAERERIVKLICEKAAKVRVHADEAHAERDYEWEHDLRNKAAIIQTIADGLRYGHEL